jgi:hypothetical protein
MVASADFWESVPAFESFAEVVRPGHYRALPDDWWLAVTDVVGSTAAIAAGRYKTVNMAGASAISATMNALGGGSFPFVFGGDGATFAVWGEAHARVADALARTARWVADDLDLKLRAALVPMAAVREAGCEASVARFRAAPDATYAMFAGGGVAWATQVMKAGRFAIAPAGAAERPDLSGLSCRWTPMEARHGAIVSLIVQARPGAEPEAFARAVEAVLALVSRLAREGHPVPEDGPGFAWPPAGLDLEARASRRRDQSVASRRAQLGVATAIAWGLDRTRWKVGGFDPLRYRRTTARNADYRKYDDGLRLTIDCDDATVAKIEAVLAAAREQGQLDFGIHRQRSALMTCIVPSFMRDDHFHFVDGAEGGYTRAALAIKSADPGGARGS